VLYLIGSGTASLDSAPASLPTATARLTGRYRWLPRNLRVVNDLHVLDHHPSARRIMARRRARALAIGLGWTLIHLVASR